MTGSHQTVTLRHWPVSGFGGLFVSPGYGRHPDRIIDTWELIMVRSGSLHIEENAVEFRIGAGEALLMPPFRRHRGLSEHPEDLSFYWVHFSIARQRLAGPLEFTQHTHLQRPQRLAELFHQYLTDQSSGILTPMAGNALLLLMLNETILPNESGSGRRGVPVVRKAEEYISHQLRRGINPGEVARECGYNLAYLSRLFRQVHGVTLGEFIHRVQLAQARTLLQNSASPLKQIADQCGFHDIGYFRRLFRRELGMSPREYRSRFGQVHINRG